MPVVSTPRPVPAAVLWDMDGTIVDTEPYWLLAEAELVTAWGGVWTHADGLQLVGKGLRDSAEVLRAHGVELPVQEIVDTLTDRVLVEIERHIPWRPGARELLAELREAGIPAALVTMSIRRMAERVATALEAELGGAAFTVIVAGDDVAEAKPHPEPYLRAAELLQVAIEECVAIEDSEPGVASAVASGATVLAVPFHVPIPESSAYRVLPNGLAGIGLPLLREEHAARRMEAIR